jgi:hypothetical protein
MGIAWFDDEAPLMEEQTLRVGGLPLLSAEQEWPVCTRCGITMLFRAQIPLVLTSLVPPSDKRLLLIFECHAGYLGSPCNSGAVCITGDDVAIRQSAPCTNYGVILRDLGKNPDPVVQAVLSLADREEMQTHDDVCGSESFPPPRNSDQRLKSPHSCRPESGVNPWPCDPNAEPRDSFTAQKTGHRKVGDRLRLPTMVVGDLSESMGSEVLQVFTRLGATAEMVPMAPAILPAVRGGRLIAFDDAIPGLRKTTLPPLDEIRSLFGERSIRGLIGGATPGYRDYAFRCTCGRQTRTAVRLLADTSMKAIRLGAAVAQICVHCGTGSLYRM